MVQMIEDSCLKQSGGGEDGEKLKNLRNILIVGGTRWWIGHGA